MVFQGACDASGAVPLGPSRFAMADDEDNWLRIYDAEQGGAPLGRFDVSPIVFADEGLAGGGDTSRAPGGDPKHRQQRDKRSKPKEMDLEAATYLGEVAYWLSSHGRSKSGKRKTERLVFFATTLPSADGALSLVGEPYRDLLAALTAHPPLADYDLQQAAERAPKDDQGMNIEGLTATPDGKLLLGFRNPVPRGRALLVPIENPAGVPRGEPLRLGDPIELDLGGMGVRGLSWWRGNYLIVAGPRTVGASQLYTWRGPGLSPSLLKVDLQGFNPEGFFTPEQRDEIMLLSDDGTVPIDGVECKRAPEESKRFRGLWLKSAELPQHPAQTHTSVGVP